MGRSEHWRWRSGGGCTRQHARRGRRRRCGWVVHRSHVGPDSGLRDGRRRSAVAWLTGMNGQSGRLLLWSPRILGVLLCLFLSVFALDAFGGRKGLLEAVPDFVVHMIPTIVLLAVVGLSWRREWIGGIVFVGLAFAYAYMSGRHVTWIAAISGPLLVVGGLFLWSWARRAKLRAFG